MTTFKLQYILFNEKKRFISRVQLLFFFTKVSSFLQYLLWTEQLLLLGFSIYLLTCQHMRLDMWTCYNTPALTKCLSVYSSVVWGPSLWKLQPGGYRQTPGTSRLSRPICSTECVILSQQACHSSNHSFVEVWIVLSTEDWGDVCCIFQARYKSLTFFSIKCSRTSGRTNSTSS